jgi:hypothetical protein
MEVRRADAGRRKLAIVLVVAATCAGAVLIGVLDRYRCGLADWVRADPGRFAQRVELLFAAFAVLLLAPVVAMAAYLSSVGGRTVRTREFPPPGARVINDTEILSGDRAVARGRWLQGAAAVLAAAALLMGLLLWRLAASLIGGIK